MKSFLDMFENSIFDQHKYDVNDDRNLIWTSNFAEELRRRQQARSVAAKERVSWSWEQQQQEEENGDRCRSDGGNRVEELGDSQS